MRNVVVLNVTNVMTILVYYLKRKLKEKDINVSGVRMTLINAFKTCWSLGFVPKTDKRKRKEDKNVKEDNILTI